MNKPFLQRSIDLGLLAVLLLFPVSVHMEWLIPGDETHPVASANISLADVSIFVVFLLWTVKVVVYREWNSIKWPPASVLAFIGFGFLSFVHAFSIGEWAKELVKMIEYFFLLYVLLANNSGSIRPAAVARVFFITTTAILLFAFVQHILLKEDEYLIRGMFSNNNILGVFLCIAVPLIYSRLVFSRDIGVRVWMGILLLLAFVVLLSGSALLSVVTGLSIMTVLSGRKKLLFLYWPILLLAGLLYKTVMPELNIRAMRDFASVYEQGSISRNYYHRIETLPDFNKDVLMRKEDKGRIFQIAGDLYLERKVPKTVSGNLYKDMDGKKHIKNRYLEMQASLNLLSENTLLGLGLGNYQNNIGKYYSGFPKVNTAEPNEDNGYLVIASTTGILGLSAFLWIFLGAIKHSREDYRSGNAGAKALSWGLLGSLAAILTENFFSYLLTASLLVPVVFLIYLSFNNNSLHADHPAQSYDL